MRSTISTLFGAVVLLAGVVAAEYGAQTSAPSAEAIALLSLQEVSTLRAPKQVIMAPDGAEAYLLNAGADAISILDLQTGSQQVIPVPYEPQGMALTPDGSRLLVSTYYNSDLPFPDSDCQPPVNVVLPAHGYLYVIDTNAATVQAQIALSGSATGPTFFDFNRNRAIVFETGGRIDIVQFPSGARTELDVPYYTGDGSAAITPDGSKVFFSYGEAGSIRVLDLATLQVRTIAIGPEYRMTTLGARAVDPTGQWLLASALKEFEPGNFTAAGILIDARNEAQADVFPWGFEALSFSASGSMAYAALSRSSTGPDTPVIVRLDLRDRGVETIRVRGVAGAVLRDLKVSPDESVLYVTKSDFDASGGFVDLLMTIGLRTGGELTQALSQPAMPCVATALPLALSEDGSVLAAANSATNSVGFGSTAVSVPTSVDDSYGVAANTPLVVAAPGVLANDNSNDGGAMTVELVTNVTRGTLALGLRGNFTYSPDAGFVGVDRFAYRAVNIGGASASATVSITVTQLPPTAVDETYAVVAGTPLVLAAPGVLGNDDSHGGGAMSASLVTDVGHGVLVLGASGGFTYTAAPGFVGEDRFAYRATNIGGGSNVSTVTLRVSRSTTAEPPSGLVAHSVAGNLVTLRWTPPMFGAEPTGYVIEGGINPGQVMASIPTGSAYPVYTFLAPAGSFFVRIHTLVGASRSPASNEIRLHVTTAVPPSPPMNVLALVNDSTLALAWTNTFAGGEPTSIVLEVSGSLATSLALGLGDSVSFAGVPAGVYTLVLRARNAAGTSPPSEAVSVVLPGGCSGPPLVPATVLAHRVGRTVVVAWTPATTGPAPTSYELQVTGAFVGSFATNGRAMSGVVSPGSYSLRVVAANACGASAATPLQTVVVP
jgi:hypothetical protein